MPGWQLFSPTYEAARSRFLESCRSSRGSVHSYPLKPRGPEGEQLAVDVSRFGDAQPERLLIVSSGLHGAEGYLGSAIQLALLAHPLVEMMPQGCGLLLIHALNPYGFAWRRRWNEENVDLNRNFLLPGESYEGSPPLYSKLDPALNPGGEQRHLPLWWLIGSWSIRYGYRALQQTIPVGQYDFPQGVFFGGHAPSETLRLLDRQVAGWVGAAQRILHLDIHSGLGRWANCDLLLQDDERAEWVGRMKRHFGKLVKSDPIPGEKGRNHVAYCSKGTLGTWCQHRFADRSYDFATAEFGTYSAIRVLSALRAENRLHQAETAPDVLDVARRRVVEAFAPRSRRWRNRVVELGVDIVRQGLQYLYSY